MRPSPKAMSPTDTSAAIPDKSAWCTRHAPSRSVCDVTYSSKPASAQSPRITNLIRNRNGSRLARSTDSSCARASPSPPPPPPPPPPRPPPPMERLRPRPQQEEDGEPSRQERRNERHQPGVERQRGHSRGKASMPASWARPSDPVVRRGSYEA